MSNRNGRVGQRRRLLSSLIATTLIAGLLVAAPPPFTLQIAEAATFPVTRFDDPTPDGCAINGCSLREAIADADFTAGPDTVTVPAGDYVLSLGPISLANAGVGHETTITGAGADTTRIDALGSSRVFVGNSGYHTIEALTVTGGTTAGAGSPGGGLLNFGGSTVVFRDAQINANTATGGAHGGGIYNTGGNLVIERSTMSGNSSDSDGGAIYSAAGGVIITNSTLSGNGSGGTGGAIYLQNGTLVATSSTITDNAAGFIAGVFSSGTTALENTILADNLGADCWVQSGTFESRGYNIIGVTGDPWCTVTADTGDQFGSPGTPLDPRLGYLDYYGGTTFVHQLLVGSPAIDAGSTLVATDQRGVVRPVDEAGVPNVDAGADIGAFEGMSTIQEAIYAADEGDTVNVPAGTYYENLYIGDDVTLAGAGIGATIISGSNDYTTLDIGTEGHLTVTIEDLSVVDGYSSYSGGGIAAFDTDLTLNRVEVAGNVAEESGGGIYVGGGSEAIITDSIISDNGVGGAGALDQSNASASGSTAGCGYGFAGSLFQGFVPASSSLGMVELRMRAGGFVGSLLHINIREGGPQGPIVASANGYADPNLPTGAEPWIGFPLAIAVDPGSLYVIEIDEFGRYTWFYTDPGDPYPAASSWAKCGVGGIPSATPTNDYDFRTYAAPTGDGGGIFNADFLTIANSSITNNFADNGGGLYNELTATIEQTDLSGNTAASEGGAVYTDNALTVTGGQIHDNTAQSGGAIFNRGELYVGVFDYLGAGEYYDGVHIYRNEALDGGALYITDNDVTPSDVYIFDSALWGNHASNGGGIYTYNSYILAKRNIIGPANTASGSGGAIYQPSSEESGVDIFDNAVVYNSAGFSGGGIHNEGEIFLETTTISGNSADMGGGYSEIAFETTDMDSVTITNNHAGDDGGGIYNAGGTINVENTIVAGNFADGSDTNDCSGPFASYGHNLVGDNGDAFGCGLVDGVDGDIVGTTITPVDPVLGPLATVALDFNGGAVDLTTPYSEPLSLEAGDYAFRYTVQPTAQYEAVEVTLGALYSAVTETEAEGSPVEVLVPITVPAPIMVNLTMTDTIGVGSSPAVSDGLLVRLDGPASVHPLSPSSPAVETGATTLATDQRGLPRPAPIATPPDIGAYELQTSAGAPSIELSFFGASDPTPVAGASSIAVSALPKAALTTSSGPAAAGTAIREIESAPLNSTALNSTALNSTALNSTALNSTALNSTSLDDAALNAVLLSDVPIAGGWTELLKAPSALAGRPLQSVTLLKALQDPVVAGRLGSFSIADLNLAKSPLGSIPYFALGMGTISIKNIGPGTGPTAETENLTLWCSELGAAMCTELGVNPAVPASANGISLLTLLLVASPVNSSALNSIGVDAAALNSTALNSVALNSTPITAAALNSTALNSVALNSVALNSTALNSVALNSTALNSVALNSTALNSVALNSVALNSTALNSVALNSVPLAQLSTVVNCQPAGPVNCSTGTLGGLGASDFQLGASYADLLQVLVDAGLLATTTYAEIVGDLADLNLLGSFSFATILGDLANQNLLGFTNYGEVLTQLLNLGFLTTLDYVDILGELADLDLLNFTNYGEILAEMVDQGFLPTETLADIYAELLGPPSLLDDLSMADVFEGLVAPADLSWQELDLGLSDLQALDATGGTVAYQLLFEVTDGSGAEDVAATVTLPPGFVLDPNPANRPQLDLAPAGSPVNAEPNGIVSTPAGQQLTWNLTGVPNGVTQLTIPTRTSLKLGPSTASGEVSAAGIGSDSATDNISVREALEPNDTFPTAVDAVSNNIYLTHLSSSDDVDLFKLSGLPVGAKITGVLGNLDKDYDLVLYQPVPQQLRGPAERSAAAVDDSGLDLIRVEESSAESVGDVPLLDLNLDGDPEAELAVHTVSAHRGTRTETIKTDPVRVAGDYYLQVTGYNGAASAVPYSLRMKVVLPDSLPPCIAPALTGGSTATTGTIPQDVNTLFLVNHQRLEAAYGLTAADAVMTALGTVAAANELGVIGAIIAVDDPANTAVTSAYAAWNGDPCSIDAANRVASSVADLVDGYRSANAGIEYVVIVGADDQIPQFRVPDEVYLSNENTYASTFGILDDPLSIALDASMLLTDDPYADPTPVDANGRQVFIPDVALGRLVERPTEIVAALDHFTTYNGLLDPSSTSSAFVTGYDFLTDGAEAVADQLDDTVPARTVSTLISDTWQLSNLLPQWLTGDHTITSINAHFDHNQLQPADETGGLGNVGDVIDSGADTLDRAIIFSMGCHSGLSVSDIQIGGSTLPAPAATDALERDWAQTFAEQGAVYAANTGFGYGDTEAVALSELLMSYFADNLDGSMSVGQALQFAKHRYASGTLVYGAFDDKILMEATFYGLPFYAVGANPTPVPPADPLPLQVDSVTGLTVGAFDINLVLGTDLVEKVTPRGFFYAVDGKTQVTPLRPIQPRVEIDATQPGDLVAHGAIITALQSFDETGFNPVVSIATVDLGANEPEPKVLGSFPSALQAVNRFQTKAGVRDQLVLVPGQFRSTGTDVGVQRLFTNLEGFVFYSPAAQTDRTAPTIQSATGTGSGAGITFDVKVADTGTGVARVYVLFRDPGSSTWTGLDLAPAAPGRWSGSSIGATGLKDFFVQAVDLAGNVAVSSNKADLFITGAAAAPSPIISVGGTQNGDWFDGIATIELVLDPGVSAQYNLDENGFTPYSAPFDITEDGVHNLIILTSAGGLESATIFVDGQAPVVTSSIEGATFFSGQVVPYAYSCTDAGSGVASCVGPQPPGTLFVATPGTTSFAVTATDNVPSPNQHTTVATINYTVLADPPSATINEDVTSVDEGTELTFTADVTDLSSPSAGVGYQWDVRFNTGLVLTSTEPALTFTALDDGDYEVGLVVVDLDSGLDSGTPVIEAFSAGNVAPTIALSGAALGSVNDPYVLTLGTVIDPGADNVFEITVDWGDGSLAEAFPGLGDVSHTYTTDGTFDINVTLEDEDGIWVDAGHLAVDIAQVPEITSLTVTPDIVSVSTGLVSLVADYTGTVDTATIDWGDLTAPATPTPAAGSVTDGHVYTEPGVYTVTLTLTGPVGEAEDDATVEVLALPPSVTISRDPATVDEGDLVTYTAVVTDTEEPVSYAWTVTGAGAPFGLPNASEVSFTPPDDGAFEVELVVTDQTTLLFNDPPASDSFVAVDVEPTIEISGAPHVNTDVEYELTLGEVLDPGSDVISVDVDWGDGGVSEDVADDAILTHTYYDPGLFTITVDLSDDEESVSVPSAATLDVTVTKLPFVGPIAATPDVISVVDGQVSISAPFVGTVDTATVSWGDGAVETATVGTSTITASHDYTTTGLFTVAVTASNSFGEDFEKTFDFVVVFDPNGSSVKGNPKQISPAGAYQSNLQLSGEVKIGFNVKYKKNSSEPTGKTKFEFKDADLKFEEETFDWMIFTGAKVRYQGTGEIKDQPGLYGFEVIAIDGDLDEADTYLEDEFGIRIWNLDTELVVYNTGANGPATLPLSKGKIQIKAGKNSPL